MLLDTSVIVEIFRRNKSSLIFREIMKNVSGEELFVSAIQLAEIANWSVRNGSPASDGIYFVKETASLIPLDEAISLRAAEIKFERRKAGFLDFGLIDGIILASARSIGKKVLTLDPHFVGEGDCIVLGG